MIEFCLERGSFSIQRHTHKLRSQAVACCWHKLLNLTLTLHNQAHSHRLHTTCAQTSNDLFPQNRRQFKAHNTVHHTTCLLRIDQIIVNITRMIDCLQNRLFGRIIECDTAHFILRQLQYLLNMPCDRLSLAVRVAC